MILASSGHYAEHFATLADAAGLNRNELSELNTMYHRAKNDRNLGLPEKLPALQRQLDDFDNQIAAAEKKLSKASAYDLPARMEEFEELKNRRAGLFRDAYLSAKQASDYAALAHAEGLL
jgi:hypothetical protein